MKRVVSIMVVVVLALGGGVAGAKSKDPSTVVVRGGWVNDAPCLLLDPASVKPGSGTPPQDIQLTCTGTTLWNGGFTGRTVIEVTARADTVGNIHGTADEWFYGVYTADNRVGGLHMTHRFSVDGATGEFVSEATLIGGTCGFAGSKGTGIFIGHSLFGGYTWNWIPSKGASPAPAACVPIEIP